MSTTNVLGITQMVSNQENKHVTFNDAIADLELIASRLSLAVSPTTGTMTLTADQSRVGLLELTGTLTGALAVEFAASQSNLVVVYNGTAGAFALTVKIAGNATTITIPKGCAIPIRLGTSVALDKRQSIPMPKLIADLANDQAITQSTTTRVDFDNIVTDNASGWDAANKKYVCPVAGWYEVHAAIQTRVSGVSTGSMVAFTGIRKNGSEVRRGVRFGTGDNSSPDQSTHCSCLLQMAAGDTIDVVGYCGRSGTTFLGFEGTANLTWVNIRCVELA